MSEVHVERWFAPVRERCCRLLAPDRRREGDRMISDPTRFAQSAFTTSQKSNTVSVIDTVTNSVVVTIPVLSNSYGVAVSPDGRGVY